MTQVQPATNVTRFGLDDILGNEVVDFAVLDSNYRILGDNAAHTGQDNTFQGGDLFNVRQAVRAVMAGGTAVEMLGNAYFDGTNYQRYNAANAASRIRADNAGNVYIETAAAAANPITNWVVRFQISPTGIVTSIVGTLPPGGTQGQALVKNSATNYDAIWVPTSNVGALVFEAQNISGTTVTLLQPPMVNGIMGVYVNGQALIQTRDWTIAGSVITFTQALSGDDVHIEYLQTTSMGTDAASVDGLSAYPANNPQPNQLVGLDANGKLPQSTIPATSNLLVNGGFDLWSLGTSFSWPPATNYSMPGPDGWELAGAPGTVTLVASRNTSNSDGSGVCAALVAGGTGFGVATLTQYVSSPALYSISSNLWGVPLRPWFAGKVLTLTARVRCSTAGAVTASLWDGTTISSSQAHSGGGAYETLTVTATMAAGTSDVRAQIRMSAAATAYVDNVVLVIGNTAPAFAPTIAVPDWIPNARLGSDAARANLLVNGGFEVWQRGPGPFTQPVWTADRWACAYGATDQMSISKDTTNVDYGSNAALSVSFTGGNNGSAIDHNIMLADLNLRNRTVAASMRLKTSQANAVRIRMWDGKGPIIFSPYHSGSGQYETLTLVYQLAYNATLCLLGINFVSSCQVYADNAMLVSGSVPTDYIPMAPADELARCMRYYHRIGAGTMGPGLVNTASQALIFFQHSPPLAVMPTVTTSPLGNIQVVVAPIANLYPVTSLTIWQALVETTTLLANTAGGLTVGQGAMLRANAGSDYIAFEANP